MIKWFYNAFDYFLRFIMKILVDWKRIENILAEELKCNEDNIDEKLDLHSSLILAHIEMIHSRVSTLIAHVSIMLAVLMYSLSIYPKNTIQSTVAFWELSFYLFCTIVCIRCLKAYGFELDKSDNGYKKYVFNDLVLGCGTYFRL